MKSLYLIVSRIFVVLALAMLLPACGRDEGPVQEPADAGTDIVSGGDVMDVGEPDATPDAGPEDTGPEDTGHVDTGGDDAGSDVRHDDVDGGDASDADFEPVQPPADYLPCANDFDCPINGSVCTRWVPFNRVDTAGVEEVDLSELFEGLEAGQGVCTQPCSSDPTVCNDVTWPDDRGQPRTSSCVVVALGAPPYKVISEDPFEVEIDFAEMQAGQAFAAICMPAFDQAAGRSADFCRSCNSQAGCGAESSCFNLLTDSPRENVDEPGQSFCLEHCADQSECPMGFECQAELGEQGLCVPLSGTCTACIDHDGDGFGTGHCGPASARQTPYDCDDANPQAYYDPADLYHSFPTQCGAFDFNCDGLRDDLQMIGSEQWGNAHCTACDDSCQGPASGGVLGCALDESLAPYCTVGCEVGRANCNGDWSDGCEVDMTDSAYLYWQDADGDGFGDDALGAQFFCTFEEAQASLTNPIQQGGDCDDDDDATYPGAPELCNGKINDCSQQNPVTGELDGQDVTAGDTCTVPGVFGICSAGQVACGQDGLFCEQTVFPAAFETCNGLDDTCNGLVDDGDVRGADGVERAGDSCDTGLLGQCQTGAKACVATGTDIPVGLTCKQTVFPTLEQPGFDGIDHSCDGFDRYLGADGEPHAIFVAQGGAIDLSQAVELASQCSPLDIGGQQILCDVFLQNSRDLTSASAVVLVEGVDIYGGFSPTLYDSATSTWDLTSFQAPTYTSATPASKVTVSAAAAGDTFGVRGQGIQRPTHVWGVEVQTQETFVLGAANYGGACKACEGLRLRQFVTRAGAAGPGLTGAEGTAGGNAALLINDDGERDEGSPLLGFIGPATGGVGCVYNGGDGGFLSSNNSTRIGLPGEGPAGGAGGTSSSRQGKSGGGGTMSAVTPAAPVDGSYGTLLWNTTLPAFSGTLGTMGSTDLGVQGSGGGGSYATTDSNGFTFASGGGGGGCNGAPGSGGATGPASVGFLLAETQGGITLTNVGFHGARGGRGGIGGRGGKGGRGSLGMGNDVYYLSDDLVAGSGGFGAGGHGGAAGNGGLSIGFLRINSSLGLATSTTYVSGQGGAGGEGGPSGLPGDDGLDVEQVRRGGTGTPGAQGLSGWSCREYRTLSNTVSFGDVTDPNCVLR